MKKLSVRNPNGLGVKVAIKKAPDLINHNKTTDWTPASNYRAVGEPVEVVKSKLSYAQWVDEQLVKIPEDFRAGIKAKYSELLHSREHESEGVRLANNFILDSLDLFSGFSRKRLAGNEHFAKVAAMQIRLFGLEVAAEWAKQQGATVPRFPTEENNLDATKRNSREAVAARLCSPEWWDKQLTKRYRRNEEAVQIRAGKVCKGVSPYVSAVSLEAYEERQTACEEWKKQAMLLSNEGDEISLDSANHEHAAAFIQFAEFMVRVNGMSAIAAESYLNDEVIDLLPDNLKRGDGGTLDDLQQLDLLTDKQGLVGICFTLTTPSRFHRYSTRANKLTLNKRYDTSKTPADARDWLQETWKLTQTAWKRKTKRIQPIQGFGFRMDESHHDGVSHYHYAIWVHAADAKRATEIFYNKALRGQYTDRVKQRKLCQFGQQQDATEKGALVRRLNFKVMTSAKGMVSYMVKYITKGLTGADWEDLKAGVSSNDTIIHLMARKSVWGLRQYAFWNSPSVMAWRELRRMEEVQEDQTLEAARVAAKNSDWKAFTEVNGGATCPTNQRPIRMLRKPKMDHEEGKPALNQYGEVVEQIRGLLVHRVEKQTRFKDWYLLNVGSLKQMLINQFARESHTLKADLPVAFSDDIQAVIDIAKARGKLSRLADKAGIVMFNTGQASSSSCASAHLGLVGITSHEVKVIKHEELAA